MKIEGLVQILPPQPTAQDPGPLSDQQVSDVVRFWNKPQFNIEEDIDIQNALLRVQAACQEWANRNRNSRNYGLEECNLAAVDDGTATIGLDGKKVVVNDGVGIVAYSKVGFS